MVLQLPETFILSKLTVTFLKNETCRYVWVWQPVQFEKKNNKPLVCVAYSSNLVWNIALMNLAKRKLHIKYGFDKVTYQISKVCAS